VDNLVFYVAELCVETFEVSENPLHDAMSMCSGCGLFLVAPLILCWMLQTEALRTFVRERDSLHVTPRKVACAIRKRRGNGDGAGAADDARDETTPETHYTHASEIVRYGDSVPASASKSIFHCGFRLRARQAARRIVALGREDDVICEGVI
jgi:hypothetical protein